MDQLKLHNEETNLIAVIALLYLAAYITSNMIVKMPTPGEEKNNSGSPSDSQVKLGNQEKFGCLG